MAFFRKKKKALPEVTREEASHKPKEPPPAQQVPTDPPHSTELTSSTDCEASPTVVREPSSIFGGMVLSSSVRKNEGQDSPYLFRGGCVLGVCGVTCEGVGSPPAGPDTKTENDEPSAFGFISGSVSSEAPPLSVDKVEAGGTHGEAGEGEEGKGEKSAFGFISLKPTEQPGFSFLNHSNPDPGAEKEEGKETVNTDNSSQEVNSHINSQETSTSPSKPPPAGVTHSKHTPAHPGQSDLPQPVFRNSSGVLSPVPSPMNPPLATSHPSPAGETPEGEGGGGGRVSVGKQQPTAGKKKKKKRTVVRPGQERPEDPLLVDTASEDTGTTGGPASSCGVRVGDEAGKREPDSLSLASQTSSVEASSLLPTSSAGGSEPPVLERTLSESKATTDGGGEVEGRRLREEGGEAESDGGVCTEEEAPPQTQLLVDMSTSTTELPSGEREGGETVVFQDQQLLAEVFAGGRSESRELGEKGEGGSVEKGKGEGEKTGDVKGGNYSVELTSSDQFNLLIQSSESNLARIRLELAELHNRQQSVLDKQILAAKEQRQNRQKMKELRAREAKALSEEDYELAEELQGQLESAGQDTSWNISSTTHPLFCEWLQEVCDLIQSEETVQSDMRAQLAEMREEQSQALASAEEEIAASQTKQKLKLKALEDKVERERGHIALDREHLRKREQQLQEEIASRAERFLSKKTSLQQELQTVHSGIAELEERLAGLRQEETRLETAISEEEAKIEAVHRELDSENSSLHEEREGVSSRERDLLVQQEGVEEVKQEYELAQEDKKAQRENINGLLGRVDVKWEESERRTHTLVECLGRAEDLGSMDTSSLLSPSPQLQKCRAAVQEREGGVREVARELEALQGTISQLRRQVSAAEERIPQLEETKKTAVAARQYKEAGRVSSELKQLKTELKTQRTKLTEREGEVAGLNQRLAALSGELARERGQLEQLERREDTDHLRMLTSSLSRLHAAKTSIPGSSSPLEKVLDYWLQLYQLLAEGLCAKHDLELSDFATHTETRPSEREERVEEMERDEPTVDTGGGNEDSVSLTMPHQKPPEERTPGVGREEGGEGEGNQAEVEGVRKKIEQLEARIEEAVSEEVEDYELAAELDKELRTLKEELTSLVSS